MATKAVANEEILQRVGNTPLVKLDSLSTIVIDLPSSIFCFNLDSSTPCNNA